MIYKFIPLLAATLLSTAGQKYFYQNEDVYKVNEMIRIKNLYFRDGEEMGYEDISKVITFDIVFHTTNLPDNIYANNSETDDYLIERPYFVLDWRQGMQYQPVELCISTSFTLKVSNNELIRITYGDLLLFSFKSPHYMSPTNSYSYDSIDDLPSNMIFKSKINFPHIKNGKIESFYYEYTDLSWIDFDKIENYYYGKFPNEYLWVKFHTDLYGEDYTMPQLRAECARYEIIGDVYMHEIDLFEDYYPDYTLESTRPYFDFFRASDEIGGYYQLEYPNVYKKRTFTNGIMRTEASLTEYELKYITNKPSKFLTYPLDEEDFEKNYALAKNMTIKLNITTGIFQNFRFSVTLQNDLKKDFYYNHLSETTINGTHKNSELETVDIMYA